MGDGERSLCLQPGGRRDSGDNGERGDPAESGGGVTAPEPWMGLAPDDIAEEVESKGGEEGRGRGHSRGSTTEDVKHRVSSDFTADGCCSCQVYLEDVLFVCLFVCLTRQV